MKYNIKLNKKAVKEYKKLDKFIRKQIKHKLYFLQDNPSFGKYLRYCSFYSLRVGDYRVIYKINNSKKIIIILYIGHRRNVYVNFSKLF